MHNEDIIVNAPTVKKKTVGTVYAAVKHAHRHGLNVKLKLPAAVKETLRNPSDEERFLSGLLLAGRVFTQSLVPCCSS